MFDQRLLDREIAALGIQKQGKLTYALCGPNRTLSWTLSFRLLGVYRWEIDGELRASHAVATPFARACLAQFAGGWWADTLSRNSEIGAGIGFPVANLTNWSQYHTLKIKDLTAQESASRVASDVNAYVLPFVQSVQDDNAYLDHLLADEMPMKWLYCQPLTRFAEAVKLSLACGRSVKTAMQALERESPFAKAQLHDIDLDAYVASVVRAASDV